jgi:chromosome segregation ATPase
LKQEYEKLDEEAKAKELEYLKSFDRKKNLVKERKQIKEQKEEAENFQNLLKRRNIHISKFFLWQLYQIQHKITRSVVLLEEKKMVIIANFKTLAYIL